jgi:hypothetical protein
MWPETFGNFAPPLAKLGGWRQCAELEKPTVGGHFWRWQRPTAHLFDRAIIVTFERFPEYAVNFALGRFDAADRMTTTQPRRRGRLNCKAQS